MQVHPARGLSPDPIAAAATFASEHIPAILVLLAAGEDVLVELEPADHTHREWRRAAAAMLARAGVPSRVVLLAGNPQGLEAFAGYFAAAPGVTGQYLEAAA